MKLHARIQQFLDDSTAAMAPTREPGLTVAEIRRLSDGIAADLHRQVAEPGPEVAAVEDGVVEVDGGTIRVRTYVPDGDGPFAGHLVLHGGGWCQGSIDDWIGDVQARERCAGARTVVVNVDYRLAPEHPFPTALHDCLAAWTWVLDRTTELRIDPTRLSVGGTSAGGNLAAALCLALRDQGRPLPVLQLLEAPALDLGYDSASMRELGPVFGITEEAWTRAVRLYVLDADDVGHPYVSPLRAPDLRGLPPAHILTAEHDALRDPAEAYAARLREAGVPVTLTRHAGQVHVSPAMTAVLEGARAWRAEVLEALRQV